METMGGKTYLTPSDLVARYKGKVSLRTLANWRSTGISPPYTKVNGRVLYPLDALEDWEARRTVSGTHQYNR